MRNQLVEDGGPPLRGRPSKLVMSLPVELGGLFFFGNLQDQKVHRYVGSSQLGTSRNQPLCSTPEMSNTRYHSLPGTWWACLGRSRGPHTSAQGQGPSHAVAP